MDKLASLSAEKQLISIRRDDIDGNTIQGFVLGYSRDLLALQYVYDFRLDGLMVLRLADITDIRCTATDRFQRQLLIKEGLFRKISFAPSLDLGSWPAFISQLASQHRLMILEAERLDPPEFLIGSIARVTRQSAWLNYFTGVAEWDDRPTRIAFKDITACQVGSNYLNVYERHFARLSR